MLAGVTSSLWGFDKIRPAPSSRPDTIHDCPLVPRLPPPPDCVREARCERAAKRKGGRLIRRRSEPFVYGLALGGGVLIDLTLDELEYRLFGGSGS